MSKESLFRAIKRYHNTDPVSARKILKQGINPSKDNMGNFGVYTTASPIAWSNYKRPVQFELDIPKDWYTENSVFDSRDRYDLKRRGVMEPTDRKAYELSDYDEGWEGKISDRVYNGGRTSIFDNVVPLEFIKRVCFDKGTPSEKCYDGKSLELMMR